MPDRLSDGGGEEGAENAEHGGDDEAGWIVRARREKPRNDAGDESDDDDVQHGPTSSLEPLRSAR